MSPGVPTNGAQMPETAVEPDVEIDWYSQTPEAVLETLGTNSEEGLTSPQAESQ